MIRWSVLGAATALILGVPAVLGYATLTLPESGDVRQRGLTFEQWLDEKGGAEQVTAPCDDAGRAGQRREACVSEALDDAESEWLASGRREAEVWAAPEITRKRNTYLLAAALVLVAEPFALAAALRALRTSGGRRPSR